MDFTFSCLSEFSLSSWPCERGSEGSCWVEGGKDGLLILSMQDDEARVELGSGMDRREEGDVSFVVRTSSCGSIGFDYLSFKRNEDIVVDDLDLDIYITLFLIDVITNGC